LAPLLLNQSSGERFTGRTKQKGQCHFSAGREENENLTVKNSHNKRGGETMNKLSIKIFLSFLFVGLLLNCSGGGGPEVNISSNLSVDGIGLEYVWPEEVGWSSAELEQARQFSEEIGAAAVMALYDGKVFIAWGNIATKYKVHSIRKPFLNALYGIHVQRGHIDLDETLQDLNIDDIPPSLTEEESQARVSDLLKSRSGVYHEAAAEVQQMIDLRPPRGSHPPNTFFYYNNWDFNALGTIFENETGTKIFEAFKAEIADPIGMQDFEIEDGAYYFELDKSVHPAYPFRMTARDMARFGLLYQREGNWNGERIISREWIAESTTAYSIDDESGTGYGYLWAIIPDGFEFAPGFFHTGLGVHQIIVLPEEKIVYVFRMDTDKDFADPGDEALMELFLMIMDARVAD
jgi:CubicO group peptidase (beta-lactamase class C family)